VSQSRKRRVFPFTAIVGQEEMKLALLLNVIDPRIGGVMIMGDRGTGKSTTIRALADLLPEIEVVAGDPYNSSTTDPDLQSAEVRQRAEAGETLVSEQRQVPMVDLPLGATEDRLCGTIDIEKALGEGVRAFEPGLLAKANRGLLYVDEVNLLDDHLVDVLLDSAASGWNTVEREGISVRHPARFVLIGSGNPEEGELRPQLLDRFGMSVEVRTVREPELRVQVVDQRTAFDADPDGFNASVQPVQDGLQARVVAAQQRLSQVHLDDDLRLRISAVCGTLDVDGLRGDIVTNRAARALAAFEGHDEVSDDDVARQGGGLLPAPPPAQGSARNHRFRRPGGQGVLPGVRTARTQRSPRFPVGIGELRLEPWDPPVTRQRQANSPKIDMDATDSSFGRSGGPGPPAQAH